MFGRVASSGLGVSKKKKVRLIVSHLGPETI